MVSIQACQLIVDSALFRRILIRHFYFLKTSPFVSIVELIGDWSNLYRPLSEDWRSGEDYPGVREVWD